MRLLGKRALITGGARGIGRGIVERFLQEGANVVALDRRADLLKALRCELDGASDRLATVVCDLAESSGIPSAVSQSWDAFGGLDILVNNAGIAYREPLAAIAESTWDQVMNVNLKAMFLISQQVSGRMIAQGTGGAIVNMASKNGLAASSMLTHYNASKGGVVLLTKSLSVELAQHGIRVNAVAPGFIDTPLDRELKLKETLNLTARTPLGRLGTIEEAANAFLFLASDEASYITGTTLVVDGGHLANAGEF
jgi:NAD(P)-dependent dehydrogenase (short-subunit alcohol dehydrogenase family)